MSYSLVIPCYNESKRLGRMVAALEEFDHAITEPYEVLVVDDGSKDDTVAKIQQNSFLKTLGERGQFRLLEQVQNQGKGAALQRGIAEAKLDFILTLDADIATHPKEILHWKEKLGGGFTPNTIYIATRTHKESQLEENSFRKFVGLTFNALVRTITGITTRDSQCGFKLYPNAIAKRCFKNLLVSGWAHDVEILYKAGLLDIEVQEMPIAWTVQDDSKVNVLTDSIQMLIDVIRVVSKVKKEDL